MDELKNLRIEKGMTQQEVADLVGISLHSYKAYENDDQNIEELRRIFNRKFPQQISLLEHFLSIALLAMEVVPTPIEETEGESYI